MGWHDAGRVSHRCRIGHVDDTKPQSTVTSDLRPRLVPTVAMRLNATITYRPTDALASAVDSGPLISRSSISRQTCSGISTAGSVRVFGIRVAAKPLRGHLPSFASGGRVIKSILISMSLASLTAATDVLPVVHRTHPMRAVACNTTVEPDELTLEFDHAFVVDTVCYAFNFKLSVNINGFRKTEEVAVSNDVYAEFVRQLTSLDETLTGRAHMDSAGCITSKPEHFAFTIEPYAKRGYLVVRVRITLSELNSFTGGLIVEPANLSDWTREFSGILERKEPAIDFYGNWNTQLPLPQRLRNQAQRNA
jgi:hypothetical protein